MKGSEQRTLHPALCLQNTDGIFWLPVKNTLQKRYRCASFTLAITATLALRGLTRSVVFLARQGHQPLHTGPARASGPSSFGRGQLTDGRLPAEDAVLQGAAGAAKSGPGIDTGARARYSASSLDYHHQFLRTKLTFRSITIPIFPFCAHPSAIVSIRKQ